MAQQFSERREFPDATALITWLSEDFHEPPSNYTGPAVEKAAQADGFHVELYDGDLETRDGAVYVSGVVKEQSGVLVFNFMILRGEAIDQNTQATDYIHQLIQS